MNRYMYGAPCRGCRVLGRRSRADCAGRSGASLSAKSIRFVAPYPRADSDILAADRQKMTEKWDTILSKRAGRAPPA